MNMWMEEQTHQEFPVLFSYTPGDNWEIQNRSLCTDEDVWGNEEPLLRHTGNPWVIISISLLYSFRDEWFTVPIMSRWPSSIICHLISVPTLGGYIYFRPRGPQGYFSYTRYPWGFTWGYSSSEIKCIAVDFTSFNGKHDLPLWNMLHLYFLRIIPPGLVNNCCCLL